MVEKSNNHCDSNLRTCDPIRPIVYRRMIETVSVLQREENRHYDFHLLIDQTNVNITTTSSLQEYFNNNNASHLRAPPVFSVSEKFSE